MTQRTAKQTIEQAIADFDDIIEAIKGHRVRIDYPTKTSLYAELIANIRIGSVSGTAWHRCTPALSCVLGAKEKQCAGGFNCLIHGNAQTENE
ncbi:MAG: hypothetical protein II589_02475 [Clostridia bacterium]|nr:hypothetical protein [Clostridia bacterium]